MHMSNLPHWVSPLIHSLPPLRSSSRCPSSCWMALQPWLQAVARRCSPQVLYPPSPSPRHGLPTLALRTTTQRMCTYNCNDNPFSLSTSLASTFHTQNTFIPPKLLRAIILQQVLLYSLVPPPSLVLSSHIRLMPSHPPNTPFRHQSRKIPPSLRPSGHPLSPPHPPSVCLCIHLRASTFYLS